MSNSCCGGTIQIPKMCDKKGAAPQECYNCKRQGVAPDALIIDKMGNVWCSQECGWSYILASPAEQEILRNSPRQLQPSRALEAERQYEFSVAQTRHTAARSSKAMSSLGRARPEHKPSAEAVSRPVASQALGDFRQTTNALFEFHQFASRESEG